MRVSQGSVLSPFLFLVYINALSIDEEMDTVIYSDDTTLMANDRNHVTLN